MKYSKVKDDSGTDEIARRPTPGRAVLAAPAWRPVARELGRGPATIRAPK